MSEVTVFPIRPDHDCVLPSWIQESPPVATQRPPEVLRCIVCDRLFVVEWFTHYVTRHALDGSGWSEVSMYRPVSRPTTYEEAVTIVGPEPWRIDP